MGSRFEGRVVVVTGAAAGLGAATAALFARDGATVVLADIDTARGEAQAASIGDRASFVATDVTQEAQVASLLDLAAVRYGRLDCLVNNAGAVGPVGPIASTTETGFDRAIALNLKSTLFGVKHAARLMIPRRTGAIVNVASTAGVLGGLGAHCYTAAKHAVVGLTRSVASELAAHGIRVNAVAPGGTRTNMLAVGFLGSDSPEDIDRTDAAVAAMSPLGRTGRPQDIAEAICFLASDAAGYITAQTLVVEGGQTLPRGGAEHIHGQAYAERF